MKRCSPSSPQLVVLPSGSFAPLDNDISTSANRINAELQAIQNAELSAGNSVRPVALIALLLLLLSTLCAETLTQQNFESSPADTWNYTANPAPSRLLWWGPTTEIMGGASAYNGSTYWAGWDLDDIESTLAFSTLPLPVGYTYTLSFYYFTKNLNTTTDFCRYSLMYDNGTSWSNWVTVNNSSNAWTPVSIAIPADSRNLRLCLSAKFNGSTKYTHWDYLSVERTPTAPAAPVISNLAIAQRTDGSGLVDIYYDLYDNNGDDSTISLSVSANAGGTYNITPTPANLSGDIGAGISLGTGKHIIWNAGAEVADFESTQYKFLLSAEDNTYPPVAAPVFTPPAGVYTSAQNVTITCATAGAEIRYTTDGSEPTESSALYSAPITVNANTTLKAKAFKTAWTPSLTATAGYMVIPANFILVEGGTFNNGTSDVTVSSFYIDKFELTQSAYQAVMGNNPANGYGVGASNPVYYVSWFKAIEYCNKRSINENLTPCYSYSTYGTNPSTWPTGWNTSATNHTNVLCNWTANGYRLPTEAEWQFAARGGNSTHNYSYSGSNNIDGVAWYSSNSGGITHTIGTKTANELGIYDMTGNVWEWNWDIYDNYQSGAQSNPHGAVSGSYRCIRGGGWQDPTNYCPVLYRGSVSGPANFSAIYSYYSLGFRVCRSVNNFALVEGGTFNNGTSAVTVSSFYMDKFELTQAGYKAVMGTNPSNFTSVDNAPVERVSWYNAIEYCNKRSMQEGLTPCYSYGTYGTNPATWPGGWNSSSTNISCSWTANGYRLPTEAEWEFAARGGNQTHNFTYSGSNTIDAVTWYSSNSDNSTHATGTKTANELGLFDMSGNVWEWNWDIYGTYPSGSQTNPHGAFSGSSRVQRGGSWNIVSFNCTVSNRYYDVANSSDSNLGFRCVKISP